MIAAAAGMAGLTWFNYRQMMPKPRPVLGKQYEVEIRKLPITAGGHRLYGELLAFGSANPCTEEQYHTGSFTTFYGRALAIVRAGEAGMLRLTATDGDKIGMAELEVK